MKGKPKILILGGGSGGLVAANKLAKIFKHGEEADITLIDKNPYHEFMPSYPWVGLNFKEPDDIRRPLKLLEKKGVRFVNDEITQILPSKKKVKTKNGEYDYDFLIVSLGVVLDPDALPGYEDAYHTWSLQGALRFREAIRNFKGGNIVIGVSGMYYRCPPAPYEIAGQLDFTLRARGLRDKTNITVFNVTPGPLSNMGPAIMGVIQEILDNKGVEFVGNFEVVRVDKDSKKVVAKDGRELPYDLLLLVPPNKPNPVVFNSELTGPEGLPIVDPETFRSKKFPEVFLIGDGANAALNLPPAGVVAHFQAEFVANEIAADVKGAYIADSFSPVAMCIMDFGDDAVLPMCEFSQFYRDVSGPPNCGVLGRGKEIRLVKMAFEAMWFGFYLTR